MKVELSNDEDLQLLWTRMAKEKFESKKLEKENIMKALKQKSSLDINKLKKGLGIKILWCCGFLVSFFVLMLLNLDKVEFLKVMSVAVALYVLAAVIMYIEYRKMDSLSRMDDSVLELMRHNLKAITSALRMERIWGFFVMPLAVPGGILISSTLKGNSIMETLQDRQQLMVALVALIAVVPLMGLLTEKMNKSAFGAQIASLQENIIKMETLG